jgi:hypothetical protein
VLFYKREAHQNMAALRARDWLIYSNDFFFLFFLVFFVLLVSFVSKCFFEGLASAPLIGP